MRSYNIILCAILFISSVMYSSASRGRERVYEQTKRTLTCVITSFISPFRAEREMARKMFADDEFIEVFVDTPMDIIEARDPKGLYKKARRGELPNFTGIDSSYENPRSPEVRVSTEKDDVNKIVKIIMSKLNI